MSLDIFHKNNMSILTKTNERIKVTNPPLFSSWRGFAKLNSLLFRELGFQDAWTHCLEIAITSIRLVFSNLHDLMTKLTNNWRFQHLRSRPTTSNTIFKKSTLESFFSRPLGKWLGFSFVGEQMIIRAIKVLIPQSIPLTIIKTVVSVRIFAVNGSVFLAKLFDMSKVRTVHLFLELTKGFPQTFNTSPTITLKSVMLGVVAPLLNRRPNLVEPSPRHSVFHSYSLSGSNMVVNQFYTHLWETKSQLTDIWRKANKKP